MRWLSSNPDKRATERFMAAYSLGWIAVIAYVMLSRAFTRWGDAGHLALGVGLAVPPWAFALRAGARHARRFTLLVTLYAFIQCYFGSKLFFESFGMQYHFGVSPAWTWNGTPAFLYFLTVPYFCTYYLAMVVAWRAFRTRFPHAGTPAVLSVRAALSYATAFAETAAMANETLRDWFSYRDPRWVMLYGSVCYGTIFFLTLPQFYALDEDGPTPETPRALVRDCLALNMLILVCYEGYAWLIAHVAV